MSNVLGAVWNLIKKIFSTILGWLSEIFGKLFWILLILVLIYFAPAIVVFLTTAGAPSLLISAFEVLAMATPYVVSAVTWLWEGGSSLLSSAWSAYSGLSTGTQAAIAMGAAALVAPQETAALLQEGVDFLGESVIALGSALVSNPTVLVLGAAAIWWFFLRGKSQEDDTHVIPSADADLSPETKNG